MSLPLPNLIDLSEKYQDAPIGKVDLTRLSPVEIIFRSTLPRQIPGYETREQQIQMARLIESALASKEHVLAEAGTGTGKGMAYLIPLYLHLKESGRAVVSTGTIALQEQLISKDIPLLENALQIDMKARLAKGKSNYLCLLRFRAEISQPSLFDNQQLRMLEQIEEWSQSSLYGDKAELLYEPGDLWQRINADDNCPGKKCPLIDDCFLAKSRKWLEGAKIIVTNHNLTMLDLVIKDKTDGHAGLLPGYDVLVVDEAHKLADVAQEALSTQISSYRIPVLLKRARKIQGLDYNLVEDALLQNDHFFNLAAAGNSSDKDRFRLRPSDPLIRQGNKLLQALEAIYTSKLPDATDYEQNILNNVEKAFQDLVQILCADNKEKYVYWVERSKARNNQKVTLHGTPVDVAPLLREMMFKSTDSVVLTSATLSTGGKFSYLKAQIGLDKANELIVESPFDYEKNCLLYLPSGLPEPNQFGYHKNIAPIIENIIQATQGRALVLFTSYKGMNEVYSAIGSKLPWTTFKQGDMPKRKLLEAFREDIHSVLFGTSSFWEGVDIPSESLSAVIIDRLLFNVPDDPIAQAKADNIKKRGGNVFASMSLPEAILSLKQGFGRLIRTGTDRGVVAILDSRLTTKGYGKVFLRSLPAARVVRNLSEIERFFGGDSVG